MNLPTSSPDSPTAATPARWFADEVQAHDSALKAYLRGSFPDVRDVDDVVQESYLRIWKARMAHPIRSARAFLFQVARHLAIDAVRRNRASPIEALRETAVQSVIEDKPDAAESLAYHEKVSLMGEALAALPDRCREIFILRKLKQVPQKEIAARLGLSERTVESQVTRGMKLCEAWLRKHGVKGFLRDER
ncbi:MAG: sigma-70 family RNA polymerase sigma factor [Verrucomicrobia bacterium]|nr:sigma-70 family RNA polymerase sigma factor [Verrucomicrobiota bacterium]